LRYKDFLLRIISSGEDQYEVQVLRSPAGEGRAPFLPPPGLSPSGEQLFEALFSGEVLRLYDRSLGSLAEDAQSRLRIKISLDPRDPAIAPFQAFSWELLRRPDTRELLGLSRRQTLVRHLAVPGAVRALPRPSRLRLLLVAAGPDSPNLPKLDLDREQRQLRAALQGLQPSIEIVEPEAPTLTGVRQALLRKECHVLHFMGHGGFLDGAGVVYFEAPGGGPDPVRGEDLLQKLADFPSIRLVTLNACESAAAGDNGMASMDPFAGVAQALVLGGLAAVVGMGAPVSDEAAIAFSRAFYGRLVAGDPVDAAVAEGRQKIHSEDRESFEWAVPIVFLRIEDGHLFSPRDDEGRRAPWWRLLLRTAVAMAALLLLLYLVALSFSMKGIAHSEKRETEAALQDFTLANRLFPWSPDFHSNLANALEGADPDTAEEHYRAATRWPGSRTSLHWYNLGRFLFDRGRSEEAVAPLEEALKRDSHSADAHHTLGRAYLKLSRLDLAREHLTAARSFAPEDGAPLVRLGELALREGHPDEAVQLLEEALERDLQNDSRRDAESLLLRAYDRTGKGEKICRLIKERALFSSAEEEGMAARWNCP
jgi:tetratricopeptide (TPR) repeat protein